MLKISEDVMRRITFENATDDSIDYDRLFNHVLGLRMVTLVGTGRTGSDFFHSLLDGHEQILQIPGGHFYYVDCLRVAEDADLDVLLDRYIFHSAHIIKFRSHLCEIERWEQLGEDKRNYVTVDIDVFKTHVLRFMNGRQSSIKNLFYAIHMGYALTTGRDILKTKVFFYHIHVPYLLEKFALDFPEFEVIAMTRDPRNVLVSGMERFRRYGRPYRVDPSASTYDSESNAFDVSVFMNELSLSFLEAGATRVDASRLKVLPLESLHRHPEHIMHQVCQYLHIDYQDCLLESTFWGQKWWGDIKSGRYLQGFNASITEPRWHDKLSRSDARLIEFLLLPRIKAYGLTSFKHGGLLYSVYILLVIFKPLSYEVRILKESWIQRRHFSGRVRSVLRSQIFYFRRLKLFLTYYFRHRGDQFILYDFFRTPEFSSS